MPLYEYKCMNCGDVRDILQSYDDPPVTLCTMCEHASMVKQITTSNFRIQGAGVYNPSQSDGKTT